MKDKLLSRIDLVTKEINDEVIKDEKKAEFISNISFNYLLLSRKIVTELFKIFFTIASNADIDFVFKLVDGVSDSLEKITADELDNLDSLILFFLKNSDSAKELIITKAGDKGYQQFKSFGYDKELESFFEYLFMEDDKFNVDKYNAFLLFVDNEKKVSLVHCIRYLLHIKDINNEYEEESLKDLMPVSKMTKFIDKTCKSLISMLNELRGVATEIILDVKKAKSLKTKRIIELENIKNSCLKNEIIDYKKIEKLIDDPVLITLILVYNNEINSIEYNKVKDENTLLKNNEITIKDELLHKYKFSLDISKIFISNVDMEKKFVLINEHFSDVKQYNNIVISILNYISYDDLITLVDLYNKKYFNQEFIMDNIDLLINKKNISIFINNIRLLDDYKMDIKKIIKYDFNILFIDNSKLRNILKIYELYGINLNNNYYDFEFLKDDYSYIIDKFIEINEYELIKDNASLITDKSNVIVKRCMLYKELGNKCVNEQGKLDGVLRKEENFLVSDVTLNEIIIENYDTLMSEDILNGFKSSDMVINDKFDLRCLDDYKINDISYKIGNLIISRYKILKNLNSLYNNKLNELYSFSELLVFSIIYNYPYLIDKKMLNNIKEKAKILK